MKSIDSLMREKPLIARAVRRINEALRTTPVSKGVKPPKERVKSGKHDNKFIKIGGVELF